ncbi:family 20 glycosylhydrolase [Ruficoccus amylovorans]|uniref:Family 20 glycosylhydrolase n=1 Tax=Ruficoccus amylovorans TaxID=1804625 RepID=A0A842HJ13_9BACT|nr:family 20 glycosylhydrolase [Ruficoccus amylovorans]MBC2595968.1 family 20 glycosylhydrolase [Ruficoccus amylovorans]
MTDLFHSDAPAVPFRGVHLDLKGLVPTFSRLLELLEVFHELRFQAVLVEWEDCFPWRCNERLRAPHAYTTEQVARFARRCEELELEIIPLVQALGHSENVLRLPEYEALREVPNRTDVFHPLNPQSPELVAAMVQDVIELLPQVKRFHLGGDEVYTLGKHPASEAFVQEQGIAALYLRQLEPSLKMLESRDVRPLLWHDEIVQWAPDQISAIADRVDLVVWGYTGDPRDNATYHYRLPHVEKLHALGCRLWAATAYKGADGPAANLPLTRDRAQATQGWAELTPRFQLQGVFATAWSRYASGRIQVSPVDGALDSLVNTALILYNGCAPAEGLDACLSLLDGIGEGEAFRQIREILQRLTYHADRGWGWVRQLEEQIVNLELEPDRASSGIEETILDLFDGDIRACELAGKDLENFLQDKVVSPLPHYYQACHLEPLKMARERLLNHNILNSCAALAAS